LLYINRYFTLKQSLYVEDIAIKYRDNNIEKRERKRESLPRLCVSTQAQDNGELSPI